LVSSNDQAALDITSAAISTIGPIERRLDMNACPRAAAATKR
jgi:hypothetical protein